MATLFTHQLPGRTVLAHSAGATNEPSEYVWFGGTDYLAMGYHETFLAYLTTELKCYGTHFGSSRNNTLQLEVYREAETLFASFTNSPAALLTSSGMLAGQLVVNYCRELAAGEATEFHYAPYTHPALRSRDIEVDTTGSWSDWAQKTIQLVNEAPDEKQHFIFSDSVRSPVPEVHDFSVFEQLPANRKIWLVIDDSHGMGILGANGRGISTVLDRVPPAINRVVVSSLNKAMGIPAGIILASPSILEILRTSPWFSGSSPAAPAYIAAAVALLKDGSYEQAHAQLLSNINYFMSQLTAFTKLSSAANYPVFCTATEELHDFLIEKGILTTCFPYPSPHDKPLVRIVITAGHTIEDLDLLAKSIRSFS
jgi:8-amino-7-oxononanoate synthase